MWSGRGEPVMPTPEQILPGRSSPMPVATENLVTRHAMTPPFPGGLEVAVVGMGCFWGAERLFWQTEGVWSTAVGYAGGSTPNPSYEEVCSGRTGHTEVVLVVLDPQVITYEDVLRVFWEGHDPTQGMRQGNDVGTQYRSIVLTTSDAQAAVATQMRTRYESALRDAGRAAVTTQVEPLREFFYAEDYHQQYLAKNPNGYCGIGGTGVSCPVGALEEESPRPTS